MSRSIAWIAWLLAPFLLLCVPAMSLAAEALPAVEDPALEARVSRVAEELRCLVCQNQTIADSNAELAKDLRREVRAMLAQGKSEREVRQFMVSRYGDFILYRPPLKTSTLVLWLGPFALLALALWLYRRIARNRAVPPANDALSASESQRLQSLLSPDSSSRRG